MVISLSLVGFIGNLIVLLLDILSKYLFRATHLSGSGTESGEREAAFGFLFLGCGVIRVFESEEIK